MDHGSFDRFTRLLGSAGSRRAALGALFGTGLAGTLAAAEAAKKGGNKKRNRGNGKSKAKAKNAGAADVTAQAADCSSPGPSSNMNGCNYDDAEFSGKNLSSSKMVGTRFRNANLSGANLSSSNMKDADFRGADLSCANLRSSTLTNADFRGSASDPTNLFGADLRSSGCAGIQFNSFTRFCGTRMCNGTTRNDNCGMLEPPLCRQPQAECTSAAQCRDDGTGTTRCETIPLCEFDDPVCCRQTGGSCSSNCDCCDDDRCQGGVCVDP